MIELEFVNELPPVVPAWCEDLAEALREHPDQWAKWPRTGLPGNRGRDLERDEFFRHFGHADGYSAIEREGVLYVGWHKPTTWEVLGR